MFAVCDLRSEACWFGVWDGAVGFLGFGLSPFLDLALSYARNLFSLSESNSP